MRVDDIDRRGAFETLDEGGRLHPAAMRSNGRAGRLRLAQRIHAGHL